MNELPFAMILAQALASLIVDHLTANVIQTAKRGIIDTVGVTLLGATEPVVEVLHKTLTGTLANGPALVFGAHQRISVLDAALINGTASHAADYDDMARHMGGHPSVALVPVIVALGEALGSTGLELLEAYVVGFETVCRLGRVVHPHHYETGWHPTSTLGVFGAAVAAARLLRLNVQQTATALAIAASQSAGIKANFGTMTKPLHVGQCVRNGLFAAQLASQGFTANLAVFEHKQGFFASYDGMANVHPELLLDQWGGILEIEQKSVGLKQFPCCGSTHPAVRAMLQLQRGGLRAEDVESILITTHRLRLPHTDNPDPKTALGAKFSVQYVTARALVDGVVRLKDFEGEAHNDPSVRGLMAKTSLAVYPDEPKQTTASSNEFAADIRVLTRTGETLLSKAPHALGRGGTNPMSDEEMWTKFSDCASRMMPQAQALVAFNAWQQLENCQRVVELTQLLEVHSA